jgi:uncharacterized protein YegJ (DUF2314 family)
MKDIDKGYTLTNAQDMGHLHPQTFEVPYEEELDDLKPGDIVKLCFESDGASERMWVSITAVDGDNLVGVLDNSPFLLDGLISYGDQVAFKKENIYSIFW